jgi:hypothetical protein
MRVAMGTKFWPVTPNVCGSSIWNSVTLLAPRILRWYQIFGKSVYPFSKYPNIKRVLKLSPLYEWYKVVQIWPGLVYTQIVPSYLNHLVFCGFGVFTRGVEEVGWRRFETPSRFHLHRSSETTLVVITDVSLEPKMNRLRVQKSRQPSSSTHHAKTLKPKKIILILSSHLLTTLPVIQTCHIFRLARLWCNVFLPSRMRSRYPASLVLSYLKNLKKFKMQ